MFNIHFRRIFIHIILCYRLLFIEAFYIYIYIFTRNILNNISIYLHFYGKISIQMKIINTQNNEIFLSVNSNLCVRFERKYGIRANEHAGQGRGYIT